jgi:predicted ATPase with chaperone activity
MFMTATATLDQAASLISALGLDDCFQPQEPATVNDTGLSEALIEDLILKFLSGIGSESGRAISNNLCLPLAILDDRFTALRQRQEIAPSGAAMLGDHIYRLTDLGRDRAHRAIRECAYSGPAPVPLDDYISSVQAQSISYERPRKTQLQRAFSDIHVEPELLSQLGPAINAGKGMFIYGPPGNGKTTIAQRITRCFGQNILIPHAMVEGGKIIKMFDASCHKAVRSNDESLFRSAEFDRRWIRIERPTVVVGGELTMDSLELKHDPIANVSEASLQLKSNCGCLLIDDFGRQRINPTELLNRWIIPLENRIDYLTLPNGRKIEVPFEQLIIFSTNLEPHDLADDAFLRRIPFKVEIGNPSPQEFHLLFQVFAKKLQVECPPAMVDYLIRQHYDACSRPLRRCHARDLLEQVVYYCGYNELPLEITEQYLDHAVRNYFTALKGD